MKKSHWKGWVTIPTNVDLTESASVILTFIDILEVSVCTVKS